MHYKSQNIYRTLSCTLHQQNHLINNPGMRHYFEKKNTSESYFFYKNILQTKAIQLQTNLYQHSA